MDISCPKCMTPLTVDETLHGEGLISCPICNCRIEVSFPKSIIESPEESVQDNFPETMEEAPLENESLNIKKQTEQAPTNEAESDSQIKPAQTEETPSKENITYTILEQPEETIRPLDKNAPEPEETNRSEKNTEDDRKQQSQTEGEDSQQEESEPDDTEELEAKERRRENELALLIERRRQQRLKRERRKRNIDNVLLFLLSLSVVGFLIFLYLNR